jgi:hypothetical protein
MTRARRFLADLSYRIDVALEEALIGPQDYRGATYARTGSTRPAAGAGHRLKP